MQYRNYISHIVAAIRVFWAMSEHKSCCKKINFKRPIIKDLILVLIFFEDTFQHL